LKQLAGSFSEQGEVTKAFMDGCDQNSVFGYTSAAREFEKNYSSDKVRNHSGRN
jgi:hypothetical protein